MLQLLLQATLLHSWLLHRSLLLKICCHRTLKDSLHTLVYLHFRPLWFRQRSHPPSSRMGFDPFASSVFQLPLPHVFFAAIHASIPSFSTILLSTVRSYCSLQWAWRWLAEYWWRKWQRSRGKSLAFQSCDPRRIWSSFCPQRMRHVALEHGGVEWSHLSWLLRKGLG